MTREEIAKDLETLKNYFAEGNDAYPVCLEEAINIIRNAEEQQEILHCKECKYNPNNPRPYADDDPIETFIHCQFMEASDFCSKGKRMEDEDNG